MKFFERLRANAFMQSVVQEFTPDFSADTAARLLGKVALYGGLVTLSVALAVRIAWYELSALIPGTVAYPPWGTTLLLIAVGTLACLMLSIVLSLGRELFDVRRAEDSQPPSITERFNEVLALWQQRDLGAGANPLSGSSSGKLQPTSIGQVYCAGVTPGMDEHLRIAAEKVSEFAKLMFAPLAKQLNGDVIATLTVVETAKMTSSMYVHDFPSPAGEDRYDELEDEVFKAVDALLQLDVDDVDTNSDEFANALAELQVHRNRQCDFYKSVLAPGRAQLESLEAGLKLRAEAVAQMEKDAAAADSSFV
jgi:hypothetical protein